MKWKAILIVGIISVLVAVIYIAIMTDVILDTHAGNEPVIIFLMYYTVVIGVCFGVLLFAYYMWRTSGGTNDTN